jgi:DNA replication licensing factor MCM3
VRDARAAEALLRFALFKEVLKPERRKRRKLNTGMHMDDETDEEGEDDEEEEEEGQAQITREEMPITASQRQRAKDKAARLERQRSATASASGGPGPSSQAAAAAQGANEDDDEDDDMEGAETLLAEEPIPETEAPGTGPLSTERMDLFRERLSAVFNTSAAANEGYIEFETMLPLLNEGVVPDEMFGAQEAMRAVEKMHDDNQIMYSEGIVYKTV